jgi:phosphoglycerate dehydrogenase-like enzyme
MKKILATPRSFGKTSKRPVEMLEEAGFEVMLNPFGRILSELEMKELIVDAEGIIIGVDPLNASVLAAARNLRAISKYGVGTDNIDLAKAREMGIEVTVTQGANTSAVADFTWAMMLCCARKISEVDRKCHQGIWPKVTTLDIYGRTLGILGLGAIGKAVAARARGFDMKILAFDICWDPQFAQEHHIIPASPEEIYKQSDFISIHLPLTPETRAMIGDSAFSQMKPTAIIVNTARGGIIDEPALVRALREGRIYGAGIDVYSEEPPVLQELYSLDNLTMGSHNASSTTGSVEEMGLMASRNLLAHLI